MKQVLVPTESYFVHQTFVGTLETEFSRVAKETNLGYENFPIQNPNKPETNGENTAQKL